MIYAKEGEEVTCENGHVMARFARDTLVYESPMGTLEFVGRPEPESGAQLPVCLECGAIGFRFSRHGGLQAHFKDGWRSGDDLKP